MSVTEQQQGPEPTAGSSDEATTDTSSAGSTGGSAGGSAGGSTRGRMRARGGRLPQQFRALLYAQRASVLGAILSAFLLELSGLAGTPHWYWRETFLDSLSFVLDCTVLWLLIVVLIAITNRVTLSAGIIVAASGALAIANHVKLALRTEPVYPYDVDFLGSPSLLLDMVSPTTLVLALVALAAVVGLAWWLGRRFEPRLSPIWARRFPVRHRVVSLLVRTVVVVLAFGLLVDTTRFNQPGNPWRSLYELNADRWHYWEQRTNYLSHGFVGGMLFNMPTTAMEQPAGYSQAAMDALSTRYERRAAKINETRTGSLDDTNVVVVLSESFTDPTQLNGFDLDRDPIPRTRARLAEGTSGEMMAQLYGGGTANMEFEALTGQSIGLFTPQLSSPYQMLVSRQESYPSAVGWFAAHGHKPIAIHPFTTQMYRRTEVYDTFGFDEFIHDTTMAETDRLEDNEFISDTSAFDEVERQIQDNDDPLLVNLVTMQNHIPVDGHYDDPIPVSGVDDDDEAERIGQYARGLEYTDQALDEFLTSLEDSDEKTVVAFYGDHLPGIYGTDVAEQNPGLAMYETPYLIWSSEGAAGKPEKVGPVSPTHFLPMLYRLADAPIPPYFALLDRLENRVSALEQGRWRRPSGAPVIEDDLDREGRRVIRDARLVQYDFSIGSRYAVDRMWPGALD